MGLGRPAVREALVVVALLALQGTLLLRTAWDKSDTADEPTYVANAYRQWRFGDLTANCESPALPKWGFAAALRLSDARMFAPGWRKGNHPLWSRPLPQTRRNLFAARSATVAVTLLAGLLLYLVARRFSLPAARLTLLLWAFSPSVLAGGSLATLDAWAAAGVALATWAAARAFERPTVARSVLLGGALALAAACKVTTLGLVPVALALLVVALRRTSPAGARLVPTARLIAALAAGFIGVLWAVYGFRFGELRTDTLCGKTVEGLGTHAFGPLPFTPWIEGLLAQVLHGRQGHRSYLFGEVGFQGWWWFYLAALALKTTLGAQALCLLRGASWLRRRPAHAEALLDLALLAYPLLLLLVMSAGRAQNGIKYLLPAFPLAVLALGRAWDDARRAFGPLGTRAAATLALLGALESAAVHPHHLMFFNLWAGGPDGGPRYLIHGDDWGQDQRRLAEWQRQKRPWRLFYTPYNGNAHHWGVFAQAPPCEPTPGFYALHAIEVHRPKITPAGCLDWLTVEEPDERLGHSIYLYLVTRDRIRRLEGLRGKVEPFWSSARQPPPAADEAGDGESGDEPPPPEPSGGAP